MLSNDAPRNHPGAFLESLEQSCFLFDANAVKSAVESGKMFQQFDTIESLKLDMYPREMIPGEEQSTIRNFAAERDLTELMNEVLLESDEIGD